jgi:hypothetical protein
MKLNTKNYKTLKTKNYLKETNLLFFYNGINRSSNNWIATEQGLKTLNFSYYKIFNKTTAKILKNSIYSSVEPTINGTTFFIKPNNNCNVLTRHILLNNFELLFFTMLAIKLNNKVYNLNQLKTTNSLKYKENMLLFYQFELTHLKSSIVYFSK